MIIHSISKRFLKTGDIVKVIHGSIGTSWRRQAIRTYEPLFVYYVRIKIPALVYRPAQFPTYTYILHSRANSQESYSWWLVIS